MQKNKFKINRTVKGLMAIGLVVALEVGNISLFTTAQTGNYPGENETELIRTQARADIQQMHDLIYESREYCNQHRQIHIQDETNQPRSILQTATDLLAKPFKSLWGWMFGSPNEEN